MVDWGMMAFFFVGSSHGALPSLAGLHACDAMCIHTKSFNFLVIIQRLQRAYSQRLVIM